MRSSNSVPPTPWHTRHVAPLLFALLAQRELDGTSAIAGVWAGAKGGVLAVGHNRLDWQDGPRFCSAVVTKGKDGVLAGKYVSGTEIWNRFEAMASPTETPRYAYDAPHLLPDGAVVEGTVRLAVTSKGVRLGYHPHGGSAVVDSYVRAMPLSGITLAGQYAARDLTVVVEDSPGFGGMVRGTIVESGKSRSFVGLRVLGRAGIATFDPIQQDGFLAWSPSKGGRVDAVVLSFKRGDQTVRSTLKRTGR